MDKRNTVCTKFKTIPIFKNGYWHISLLDKKNKTKKSSLPVIWTLPLSKLTAATQIFGPVSVQCFCFCLQKKIDAESFTAETKRYMERLIKLGKRNGLHLPKDIQEVMVGFCFLLDPGKQRAVLCLYSTTTAPGLFNS